MELKNANYLYDIREIWTSIREVENKILYLLDRLVYLLDTAYDEKKYISKQKISNSSSL